MVVSRGIVVAWLVGRCTQVKMSAYLLRHLLWPALKAAALPGLVGAFMMPLLSPDYLRIFLFIAVYGMTVALTFPWTVLDRGGRAMLGRHLGLARDHNSDTTLDT